MTQHITLAEVKAACRKAYTEKRLLAQYHTPTRYGYRVSYGDEVTRVCAIGAALTCESLDQIEERGLGSRTVRSEKLYLSSCDGMTPILTEVFIWDNEEEEELTNIQHAHDVWTGKVMDGSASQRFEQVFLKAINA